MAAGVFFWMLIVIWLVFGFWSNRVELRDGKYGIMGGTVLELVLFCLIGYKLFGSPIQ